MHFNKKARILNNNLKALFGYHCRRTQLSHLPTYIWVEPTNYCNLKCIMCPTGAGKVLAERGYMEYDLFKRVIDECHSHLSNVILAMGGESLLHPDFFRMASYAEEHQVKVELNTNATLLDREKSEELLRSGISHVSFAFDGFKREMYERVRRGADFEKTLENILNFLRLKKERRCRKPYTVLSMLEFIPGEDSSEKKEAFWEKFAGLIDDVHLREVNSWGKLFLGTRDFRYREFHGGYVPCGRLWNTLGILWNGDVVPCIYNLNHDYVVGNVREKTLAELWNTPKIVALRQAMLNGTYLELSPLCENCTIAGTPKIFGIPAGLRASLADSLSNFLGYGFEKKAVSLANILRNGKFASRRIKFD